MDKKDAYVKKMKAQLDEWSADIDKLQAKAEKAEAGLQLEYQDQMEKVRSLRTAARQKLTQLKEAGGEAWKEFKTGVETARDELENALTKAQKQIQ